MLNSLEVDVDGVSDGETVIIGAIVEHIDSAGVHSGDAMMCIPPWRLSNKIIENITDSTIRIAKEFKIKGPFNLQFLFIMLKSMYRTKHTCITLYAICF